MGKTEVALTNGITSAELSVPAGRGLPKKKARASDINEWTVTHSSEALDIRKARRRCARRAIAIICPKLSIELRGGRKSDS
jgi:hypothetical protein